MIWLAWLLLLLRLDKVMCNMQAWLEIDGNWFPHGTGVLALAKRENGTMMPYSWAYFRTNFKALIESPVLSGISSIAFTSSKHVNS
jgi:hypothetical protein